MKYFGLIYLGAFLLILILVGIVKKNNIFNFFKKNIFKILCSFIIAFLVLFITSENSPLYVMNDWVDVNAFFTVGKGMMNGLLPYKDLFEQKGPLLYLIYGIGYLISPTSYLGIFILELISFTIFIYYIIKICELLEVKKYAYLISSILAVLLCTSRAFAHGGSAEEFCFPYFAITLFYSLKFIKTQMVSKLELFINGLLAGIILMIKYTLLGLWFGYMLIILIELLINKKIKDIFIYSLIFLLGMFLPFLGFIGYFYINNGLKEFIDTYFTMNLFSYSDYNISLIKRIEYSFTGMIKSLAGNGIIILILWLFIFKYINKYVLDKKNKIYLILLIIFSVLFTYIGGKFYRYYILLLLPYMLFSLIYVFKKYKFNFNKFKVLTIIIILISYTYLNANYKDNILKSKDDYVQYEFAKIMNEYENPTVFNYQTLDTGIYFTTNLIPNVKYFHQVNISKDNLQISFDEQNNYIKEEKVDFVVMRTNKNLDYLKKHYLDLFEHYSLVREKSQYSDDILKNYYLFRLKDL